jgi:hypothetical protein
MDAVSLVFILVFFVWFPIEFVIGDVIHGLRRRRAVIRPLDRNPLRLAYVTINPVRL